MINIGLLFLFLNQVDLVYIMVFEMFLKKINIINNNYKFINILRTQMPELIMLQKPILTDYIKLKLNKNFGIFNHMIG
jgi:hypothetical protein